MGLHILHRRHPAPGVRHNGSPSNMLIGVQCGNGTAGASAAHAQQVLERRQREILPLTTAYLVFCECLKLKSMPTVKRNLFKGMFLSIVREVFNLRLRNEVFDPLPRHQTAGWKGMRTLNLENILVAKGAV